MGITARWRSGDISHEWNGIHWYSKIVNWFGVGERKRMLFVGVSARMRSKDN